MVAVLRMLVARFWLSFRRCLARDGDGLDRSFWLAASIDRRSAKAATVAGEERVDVLSADRLVSLQIDAGKHEIASVLAVA